MGGEVNGLGAHDAGPLDARPVARAVERDAKHLHGPPPAGRTHHRVGSVRDGEVHRVALTRGHRARRGVVHLHPQRPARWLRLLEHRHRRRPLAHAAARAGAHPKHARRGARNGPGEPEAARTVSGARAPAARPGRGPGASARGRSARSPRARSHGPRRPGRDMRARRGEPVHASPSVCESPSCTMRKW